MVVEFFIETGNGKVTRNLPPGFQGSRVPGLQGYKVPGLPGVFFFFGWGGLVGFGFSIHFRNLWCILRGLYNMPIFVKNFKNRYKESRHIYQRKKPQVQTTPNSLEVHQASIFLSVGGREFHRIYLHKW